LQITKYGSQRWIACTDEPEEDNGGKANTRSALDRKRRGLSKQKGLELLAKKTKKGITPTKEGRTSQETKG
jgi:hypothetical protein